MTTTRSLLITADDFGIGPATTDGIVRLAVGGRISAALLLVHTPDAERAVRCWQRAGPPADLGWHPCLTLDRPLLPPGRVGSLVGPDGRFHPLGSFLRRLVLGGIRPEEVRDEFRAQYRRFRELTGKRPAVVAAHHHLHVFPAVAAALRRLLGRQRRPPYVRRVREPWQALVRVAGARGKRTFLTVFGGRGARRHWVGFPGNDWLTGVPERLLGAGPGRLSRWLGRIPGRVVELVCHPGHLDRSLPGRDGTAGELELQRRVRELSWLEHPNFEEACRRAGLTLTRASALAGPSPRRLVHAA